MQQRVSAASMALGSRPHALYRFFDRTDALLYVGITMDLGARLKSHRREKPWWLDIHHITVEHFATRAEALAAEAKAIRAEGPLHNDQHNEMQLAQSPMSATEFAERILGIVTVSPTHRALKLAEARDAAEGEPAPLAADNLDGNPMLIAAECATYDATGNAMDLSRAIQGLLRLMPRDLLELARQRAEKDVWGDDSSKFQELVLTARYLLPGLAGRVLDSLEPMERTEWLLGAERAASSSATNDDVRVIAAESFLAFQAGKTHRGMCFGLGSYGASCPRRADTFVTLAAGHCPHCDGPRRCEGHLLWCRRHAEMAELGTFRDGENRPYRIVAMRAAAVGGRPESACVVRESVEAEMRA